MFASLSLDSMMSNGPPTRFPEWIYTNRNIIERLWARVKEWQAVAGRFEKTAASFTGVPCLAAALDLFR